MKFKRKQKKKQKKQKQVEIELFVASVRCASSSSGRQGSQSTRKFLCALFFISCVFFCFQLLTNEISSLCPSVSFHPLCWPAFRAFFSPEKQQQTNKKTLPSSIDRMQLDEYLSDDFLFPMTSRLSYASSPESDLDLSPEPRASGSGAEGSSKTNGINGGGGGGKSPPSPSGRLVKSCSDPSIATQDDLGVSGMSSPGVLLKSLSPNKFQSPINSHSVSSIFYQTENVI
jgi:hypothetical protein